MSIMPIGSGSVAAELCNRSRCTAPAAGSVVE